MLNFSEESETMIAAGNLQEFVPFGRDDCRHHPNALNLQLRQLQPASELWSSDGAAGLVGSLQEVTIHEKQKESWQLSRGGSEIGEVDYDEELYVAGNMVIWNKGSKSQALALYKAFTIDSPVQQKSPTSLSGEGAVETVEMTTKSLKSRGESALETGNDNRGFRRSLKSFRDLKLEFYLDHYCKDYTMLFRTTKEVCTLHQGVLRISFSVEAENYKQQNSDEANSRDSSFSQKNKSTDCSSGGVSELWPLR